MPIVVAPSLKVTVSPAGVGTPVSVLVATTRERSTAEQYVFTDARSQSLNYERYEISVPPTHVPWSPLSSSKVPTLLRSTTRCLGKQ